MTGNKETATRLLQHYFRLVAQRAGVQWDKDNDAEIESIVEALITASVQQVRQELETASVMQEAVAHTVHSGPDARAQNAERLRRELVSVDVQAQAGTQEADAHFVTLRHVPEVKDALTDCFACGTQIGVLLWANGRPFLQACPACGAVLRAWQNTDGDVIAVTQES